jgi:capsular exopolysaccharide synthesis family protein
MLAQRELKVAHVLAAVRRRRWLIAIIALASGIVAGVASYLQPPVYKAVASVVVEREEPAGLERVGNYFLIPEYYQTHFELLKGQGVIEDAARKVQLLQRLEFHPTPLPAWVRTFKDYLPEVFQRNLQDPCRLDTQIPLDRDDGSDGTLNRCIIQNFEQQIEVKPVRGTRLAHISVESHDSAFAAQAANAIATSYIDSRHAITAKDRERSTAWYEGQLENLRKKVEEAEQQLYAYRVKHGLVDARAGQRDVAQKLGELNAELLRAEMRVAEAQSRYEHISSIMNPTKDTGLDWKTIDSSTEVLSSPLIQNLRAQEIKASGQIAELTDKYGPLHPKLAHATSELRDLRDRIQNEVAKIYSSLRHEYEVAQARVKVVREAVNRQKQEKSKLEFSEIEYGMLDREANSTKQLYDVFLKQMKDRELSPQTHEAPVYLADPAVPPARPVKPNKKLNIMLGILGGIMSGVLLSMVLETRDRSVKGSEDLERHLPTLPVLAVVPRVSIQHLEDLTLVNRNGTRMALESFRGLRTRLLLSTTHRPRSILITSSSSGEGKTTVAANLAITMAQLHERRVLLINADLRGVETHRLFTDTSNAARQMGMYHFLTSQAQVEEIVYQTELGNLFVMPQGQIAPNPAELLHSTATTTLINRCVQDGWYVIIDSPPVLGVADTLILSTMVGGVVFVVSAHETIRDSCQLALQHLTHTGATMLGVVVQKAPVNELPAYYGASAEPAMNGHYESAVPSLPNDNAPAVKT